MKKVIIDGIEYVPKEKETWIDPNTNLVWEKLGSDRTMSWKEAFKYAEKLGDGWRLPTVQELFSLIDITKINPACKIINTYSLRYWSSTTYVSNTSRAWGVFFYYGYMNLDNKSNNNYVRCVKGD